MKMVGKGGELAHICKTNGRRVQVTSIASLPFETVLTHVDGGQEWCLGPTNKGRYFKGLSSVAFLSKISQSSIDTGNNKEHNITKHSNLSFRDNLFVDILSVSCRPFSKNSIFDFIHSRI